ncbi:LAETG motif-containing sortase-dependent surface protein [Streptomyces sp. WMMB 322]|uniref:LAETG motif-containing sortase-dependent surface protein n=1 Tax=Streptomyces sp. WMMB 322 TaxID=1286821 RepID=UPI0006E26F4E|nr:LAETG motif-containing sortase-dependent surface protein [Streptomyces sp. WMMB 322]SCK37243.1 LPXTG-motif cell wall anchor domain-containing protein [Streptomyces sp. WMMB 322]
MTAIRHRWHRAAAVATGTAALVGTGMFVASPASAHVPGWEVDCYTTSVHLENYSDRAENTIKITAGGKTLVDETFGRTFDKKVNLPEHSSPLDVHLVIDAGDDDKFDRDEHKTSPVCEESPSPTPSESSPEPSPSESSSEAPAPSEKPSTAPNGGGDDLAETGASSATPMIAGAAGVVLAAGAGLVVVSRKRRSAQD